MATLSTPFSPAGEDDEKKKAEQGVQPQQQLVGGESAMGGGASAAPSTPGGPSSSGRFTNLQKYISANKDFRQAQGGLGGQVASNINQIGQQTQQKVGQAKDSFQQQANEKASLWRDPSAQPVQAAPGGVSPAQSQSASPAAPTGVLGAAVADPTQLQQDQIAKIKAMREAEYAGPKSLMDLQGDKNLGALQVQAQRVGGLAQNARNETGRFGLLKEMFGKQGYNQGQQKLDNLIMQGQKDQLNKLAGTRRVAADTNRQLNTTAQEASAMGQNFSDEAVQTRDMTRNVLNQAVTKSDADLAAKAQQAKADLETRLNLVRNKLDYGQALDDKDLGDLGITHGEELYDIDVRSLISKAMDPTKQNVASQADYARMAALGGLLENRTNDAASVALQEFGNQELADLWNKNPQIKMDLDALRGQVAGRKAEFQSQAADPLKQTQEAIGALTSSGYFENGGLEGAAKVLADNYRKAQSFNPDKYNSTTVNAMTVGNLDPTKNGVYTGLGLDTSQAKAAYDRAVQQAATTGMADYTEFTNAMKALESQASQKMGSMSGEELLRTGLMKDFTDTTGLQASQTELGQNFMKNYQGSISQRVLDQINFERNKQKQAEDRYAALRRLFKADRKVLGVNPPEELQTPVGPGTTTPVEESPLSPLSGGGLMGSGIGTFRE